jgi:hypothetical protein
MSAMAERAPIGMGEMAKLSPRDLSLGDSTTGIFNPIEQKTLYGGMPMPEIPMGQEWVEQINPDDISVAEHELGHAFVAFSMGVGLRYATVIPNYSAGYRGLTVLEHGPINPYDLQIISAAGSHKSTRGNGSDMMVHTSLGEKSFDDSLTQARSIIGSLTSEEWKIMVQIFAYKKTITESDIPQMVRRARFELGRGVTADEKLFATHIDSIRQQIHHAELVGVIRDEVIEERMLDGTIKRYHKINGVINEGSIEIFCGSCGMKESHTRDCQLAENPITIFDGKSV